MTFEEFKTTVQGTVVIPGTWLFEDKTGLDVAMPRYVATYCNDSYVMLSVRAYRNILSETMWSVRAADARLSYTTAGRSILSVQRAESLEHVYKHFLRRLAVMAQQTTYLLEDLDG